ncbi:MAG: hypothetical protein KGL39_00095 [Patescibacteria group bacterium]|nr:hypothetical protein [Patescibacteria group bacterium]
MSMVYAFNVDHTLEISNGPVTLQSMEDLRKDGHIIGICGNMEVFCRLPDWHKRISFIGQSYLPKEQFLYGLSANIKNAEGFYMVGNIGPQSALAFGVKETGASEDMIAAKLAGWNFISEQDFANGVRQ